tara:strand:+ start:6204 stop:8009 length:1806 start_codon:yes stop_codon:yes gene_type:complete
MKILSVTLDKCSGCALMINDQIVFSTSEERYTRVKSDSTFPIKSIQSALKFTNIKGSDLDKIIISTKEIGISAPLTNRYSKFSVSEQIDLMHNYWHQKLNKGKKISYLETVKHKINLNQFPFNTKIAKKLGFANIKHLIKIDTSSDALEKIFNFYREILSQLLNVDKKKIIATDHHTNHAAYALYGSPIRDDQTLVVTADAYGDGLSGSVSRYHKSSNKIVRLKEYKHNKFQLGRIYRFATLYLRMMANEHEYKVMGLASYYNGPKREEVEKVFDQMLKLNKTNFVFNKKIKNIYSFLEANLYTYRFDHIASGLQKFTEKILVNWISNLVDHYGGSSVVFSGGTSMNVKANMEISKIKKIKKFFVCGAGTDETLPIGACYDYAEKNKIKPKHLSTLYLGEKANYQTKDLKKSKKFSVIEYKNEKQILKSLLDNKIISICRGRMEMGQRSLGNRSIVADPRFHDNIGKINRSIKQRDFWMPFAPIILFEYQDILIKNPKKINSPFMTITYETIKGKEIFPAATHQADGTARAQLLKKDQNPVLWNLIYQFYKSTGVPALLNTSFNLHGFPIVKSLKDALYVFDKSDLDVLWLDNHILKKKLK